MAAEQNHELPSVAFPQQRKFEDNWRKQMHFKQQDLNGEEDFQREAIRAIQKQQVIYSHTNNQNQEDGLKGVVITSMEPELHRRKRDSRLFGMQSPKGIRMVDIEVNKIKKQIPNQTPIPLGKKSGMSMIGAGDISTTNASSKLNSDLEAVHNNLQPIKKLPQKTPVLKYLANPHQIERQDQDPLKKTDINFIQEFNLRQTGAFSRLNHSLENEDTLMGERGLEKIILNEGSQERTQLVVPNHEQRIISNNQLKLPNIGKQQIIIGKGGVDGDIRDYVDSKGELMQIETVDNDKANNDSLNKPTSQTRFKAGPIAALKKLKYVTLTNDAAVLSRSRATNNNGGKSMLRHVPMGTNQTQEGMAAFIDPHQLFNNLYMREGKKTLAFGMMLINGKTNQQQQQKSLKSLLPLSHDQRQMSKSTLEEVRNTAHQWDLDSSQGGTATAMSKQQMVRQLSTESEREAARRMIRKIPSKIRVVENQGNVQTQRFHSVARGGPDGKSEFPITIRNFAGNYGLHIDEGIDPMYIDDERSPYSIQNQQKQRTLQKITPLQQKFLTSMGKKDPPQYILALDPPQIDQQVLSHRVNNSRLGGGHRHILIENKHKISKVHLREPSKEKESRFQSLQPSPRENEQQVIAPRAFIQFIKDTPMSTQQKKENGEQHPPPHHKVLKKDTVQQVTVPSHFVVKNTKPANKTLVNTKKEFYQSNYSRKSDNVSPWSNKRQNAMKNVKKIETMKMQAQLEAAKIIIGKQDISDENEQTIEDDPNDDLDSAFNRHYMPDFN